LTARSSAAARAGLQRLAQLLGRPVEPLGGVVEDRLLFLLGLVAAVAPIATPAPPATTIAPVAAMTAKRLMRMVLLE
jgi:hypothetical protein